MLNSIDEEDGSVLRPSTVLLQICLNTQTDCTHIEHNVLRYMDFTPPFDEVDIELGCVCVR